MSFPDKKITNEPRRHSVKMFASVTVALAHVMTSCIACCENLSSDADLNSLSTAALRHYVAMRHCKQLQRREEMQSAMLLVLLMR